MVEYVVRGAGKRYRFFTSFTASSVRPVKRSWRTRKMPRRQGLPIKYTPNLAGRTVHKKSAARRKKRAARKLQDEAGHSEDKMEVDPTVKHDGGQSEPVVGLEMIKDAPDEPTPDASSSAPTREDTLLSGIDVGTVDFPWIQVIRRNRRSQAKIPENHFKHLPR